MTAEQLEELPADVAEVIRHLTRRVIAAEKLVEDAKVLADIVDATGAKPYAVADFDEALTAYREASK